MKKEVWIDYEELALWEEEQELKKYRNFGVKNIRLKDPEIKRRKEKERKENFLMFYYSKESVAVKRTVQKSFRRKWKHKLAVGQYHIPRNREYRTYGWLTW